MERGPNPEQPSPRLTRPTEVRRAYGTLPNPSPRERAALARDVHRAAAVLDRQLSQRYPVVELPPAFDLGGEA